MTQDRDQEQGFKIWAIKFKFDIRESKVQNISKRLLYEKLDMELWTTACQSLLKDNLCKKDVRQRCNKVIGNKVWISAQGRSKVKLNIGYNKVQSSSQKDYIWLTLSISIIDS